MSLALLMAEWVPTTSNELFSKLTYTTDQIIIIIVAIIITIMYYMSVIFSKKVTSDG